MGARERSSTSRASTKRPGQVLAAGGVVWREAGSSLEVLLVHRPRYDDWSFPKGKRESGESLPACAVREVQEETGVPIVLGQPLSTQRYKLADGSRKVVHYWAARPLPEQAEALRARAAVKPASAKEIDEVRWVSLKQARNLLTHDADRDLLGELVDLWEDTKLATWTLVLVRHTRAVKRSVWNRPSVRTPEEDEATRPLTCDQGEDRAHALVSLLAAYGVDRLVTSPWKRCYDTLVPYAQAAGLELIVEPRITEHAHARNPKDAQKIARKALRERDGTLALCTHRPVLPTIMDVVAEHAPGKLLRAVPDRDPWLKTGEIMVIHLALRRGRKVRAVAIEKQRPLLHE